MSQPETISLHKSPVSVAIASESAASGPMVTTQELEAARREGYQRGFEDASAMIETQLVEQREEVAHLQQKTFQAIASHHEDLTRQVRAAIPEMTMEVVRRVLGGMEPGKDAILKIVHEVLHNIAPGPEEVEVCLSDRDLKLIESYQSSLRDKFPQIQFRADSQLLPGDCMVTSRFGTLDGRVATKLRSVDRLLQ